MSIRKLRTLVAVADAPTFAAAALSIHVTHAAVSQQMRALEEELGLTLFDRSARSPVLTPVGRRLVAKARTLIADYDNLVPSVTGDGGLSGVLTLGVMRTTLTGLTPQAVAALKDRFPRLGLHLRPGLTTDLLSDIKRGLLDVALISRPEGMPAGLNFRELVREPMHLITAPDETETDPLLLLRQRPFIRFDRGAVVGALIDNWLVSHNITVSEAMELDSPEAIASMVQAKLGVSIVPDLTVKPQDAVKVRRLPLGADAPSRVLGLAHRQTDVKMRAIDELFDAFAKVIAGSSD